MNEGRTLPRHRQVIPDSPEYGLKPLGVTWAADEYLTTDVVGASEARLAMSDRIDSYIGDVINSEQPPQDSPHLH
jgi:hypothetical protein